MNEELQQKLIQYIDGMESRLDKAEGFVTEQAPLVAQEIINWYFYDHLFSLIAVIIVLFTTLLTAYIINTKVLKSDLCNDDQNIILAITNIVACVMCAVFFGALFDTSTKLIKVTTAPRVIILEELKNVYRN